MPYFIFTEDTQGRLGYMGKKYYSKVKAEEEADEYEGLTHLISADNLVQAKRELRRVLAKKKKDLGLLYKNVRSN